ncbi:MAG: hypothetical protein IMZ55_00155 [Acidobacteria bacterium]|nr:hypothetical protein [Planctomycetota bacterium]MBE3131859.1 hypothetical protein [Acidobacteriota bacterium]
MERRRRTVSRAARALASGAAALVVAVCLAAPAAGAEAAKTSAGPSYVLPNLIAGAMCLAVVAIACKRSQNT